MFPVRVTDDISSWRVPVKDKMYGSSVQSHTHTAHLLYTVESKKKEKKSWVTETVAVTSYKWDVVFSALGLVELLTLAESLVRTLSCLFLPSHVTRVVFDSRLPYWHSLTSTTPAWFCWLLLCRLAVGPTGVNELVMNVFLFLFSFFFFLFEWALVHFTQMYLIYLVCFAGSSSVTLIDCSSVAYKSLWYNQNKSPTRGPFMLDVTEQVFGSKTFKTDT